MSRARLLFRCPGRGDLDNRRAQRVAQVLELVERFMYDLGLLIAGEPVDLDSYVEARSVERLHDAVRPAQIAGARTRPDFGAYAQVRIEGDLLDASLPVSAVVEFDDRSTRLDEDGFAAGSRRRRVRVQLLLDDTVSRVIHHRFELVS